MTLRVVDFISAVVEFVSGGSETVDVDQYRDRLLICQSCPERNGYSCGVCGCLLRVKAIGSDWDCPLGRWPAITEVEEIPH